MVAPSNALLPCHVTVEKTITELRIYPVKENVDEFSLFPDASVTTASAVSELSVFVETLDATAVEPPEVEASAAKPPEVSVVSTYQLSACPVTAMEAVCDNNNNNLLHLYSAFLGTQSALHERGESPQPPPMRSIHLDDVTAAILRQNAHHTPAYWWRGDSVMKPISVWG